MTFIPTVHVPTPPTSANTYELADRITETIGDFQDQHPDTTSLEIRQALHLASRQSGSRNQRMAAAGWAGGLIAMLLTALFVFFQKTSEGATGGQPTLLIVGVLVVVLALVGVAVVARRS